MSGVLKRVLVHTGGKTPQHASYATSGCTAGPGVSVTVSCAAESHWAHGKCNVVASLRCSSTPRGRQQGQGPRTSTRRRSDVGGSMLAGTCGISVRFCGCGRSGTIRDGAVSATPLLGHSVPRRPNVASTDGKQGRFHHRACAPAVSFRRRHPAENARGGCRVAQGPTCQGAPAVPVAPQRRCRPL